MEQLEPPDDLAWEERRAWFEVRQAHYARAGAPSPSEQACALMIDLQAVYCVGAWSAAILIAATIVESQGREAGARYGRAVPGVSAKDLRWLRGLRNRLVHEDRANPVLTIEDQWLKRDKWQREAERAVEAALGALYRGAAE
jgi:hypothetical protein